VVSLTFFGPPCTSRIDNVFVEKVPSRIHYSVIDIIVIVINLFANTSIKQNATQQSITWSDMLNRTERHRIALTSALNKIEISVKPNR